MKKMTENKDMNFQAKALSQLIEGLNVGDLPQEKQNEIILKLTETLLKRIFVETMDRLGGIGRGEYEKITEGEVAPEAIEAFFKERIHDYDDMVQKIIEEFKNEMMVQNS
jgi:hypothetical protein